MTRTLTIQFHEVRNLDSGRLSPPLNWLACMQHIDSLSAEKRKHEDNGRSRLGEVWWEGGDSTCVSKPSQALLSISGQRPFHPGEADWESGRTAPAPVRQGRDYVERVVATCVRDNVLAIVRLGGSAPMHSAIIRYINQSCSMDPALTLRLIPRPSAWNVLQREGVVVQRLEFETGMAAARRIAGQGRGLFRLAQSAAGDLDHVRVGVSYTLDTSKKKQSTMGPAVRRDGASLVEDAKTLINNIDDVERGIIRVIDEQDQRHEIDLAESKLVVQWPVSSDSNSNYVEPGEIQRAIVQGYSTCRDHIEEVVGYGSE